ncbi:MAG TPA: nucleotidyl transferase AbiEii/AbiGii toxin family protein [Polyangiaceae bacterium]|nr:nucleotidyl transferase AbiEii/AbiGii toxin family protein [Polyangiaceae bacterium]
MTRSKTEPRRNVPASVKAQLLSLARTGAEDFNSVLTRYVLERFLYRLSISPFADEFLLKGAILFTVWSQRPHRATKDIDLLGFGEPSPARLVTSIREVCATPVSADDGVRFDGDTVHAAPIREQAFYDGIRVTFTAHLGTARIPVQVDVGFGDATSPSPEMVQLPTLLAHPAPRLRGYRREVAIAEKLHAMVDLGLSNSRMKDYFDVWFLSLHFSFAGEDLATAVRSTFERRRAAVPAELPMGLGVRFADDPGKRTQWQAFIKRTRLAVEAPSLPTVVESLAGFLGPVLMSLSTTGTFAGEWPFGGPWLDPGDGTRQQKPEQ